MNIVWTTHTPHLPHINYVMFQNIPNELWKISSEFNRYDSNDSKNHKIISRKHPKSWVVVIVEQNSREIAWNRNESIRRVKLIFNKYTLVIKSCINIQNWPIKWHMQIEPNDINNNNYIMWNFVGSHFINSNWCVVFRWSDAVIFVFRSSAVAQFDALSWNIA